MIKENYKLEKNLIGKLFDLRGNTVLIVKELQSSIHLPYQRYEVMFNDGNIDVVSINALKPIK